MDMPRTLLVTNDYPPRIGGIQRTLEALADQFPADRISVFCPDHEGARTFDALAPYRVLRQPESFLWPTPSVGERLEHAVREVEADVALFGASYPLAMLGPRLARAGVPYLSAAHGFEYWLSIAPGTHAALRYATSRAARVPVMCSAFIARTVRTAVPRRVPVSVLYPGADVEMFRPDLPTDDLRERHGLGGVPLVVCVSRLVARKGQDVLIRGMARVRRRVPGAILVIVGGGPNEERLRALARHAPDGSVVFTGQVSEVDLPRYYALGDVFAMPCRTRLGGLEVEGWGNVFIEAAACAKPVVVGDSGGAREALVDGETGILVDGADEVQVAEAVADLLSDPRRARMMGEAGRARVLRDHTWPTIARPARRLAAGRPRDEATRLSELRVTRGYPGAMQSGPPGVERRCPDCGALASPDAEWCGQCFRSLAEPEPEREPLPAAAVAAVASVPGAEQRHGRTRLGANTRLAVPCLRQRERDRARRVRGLRHDVRVADASGRRAADGRSEGRDVGIADLPGPRSPQGRPRARRPGPWRALHPARGHGRHGLRLRRRQLRHVRRVRDVPRWGAARVRRARRGRPTGSPTADRRSCRHEHCCGPRSSSSSARSCCSPRPS